MTRLPLAASFALFIALCVSVAYWAMQWFKPPPRPVAAPPQAMQQAAPPDAAAGLFGGRPALAAGGNFQLRGVIAANNMDDGVAILAVDGKPARAFRAGEEVAPGVRVGEVHPGYVLLSAQGNMRRVEIPEDARRRARVVTPGGSPQKNEAARYTGIER